MGFSKQEYWSGLPFPAPGDLPNLGIDLCHLQLSCIAGRFFITEPLGKPIMILVGFNLEDRCACMRAKLLQSCPTLRNPMDCSPPDSSFHGVLQARILEWVAMPSSRGSSQPRDRKCISVSPALTGRFFTTSTTWKAPHLGTKVNYLQFLF